MSYRLVSNPNSSRLHPKSSRIKPKMVKVFLFNIWHLVRSIGGNIHGDIQVNTCHLPVASNILRSRGSPLSSPSIYVREWHAAIAALIEASSTISTVFLTNSPKLQTAIKDYDSGERVGRGRGGGGVVEGGVVEATYLFFSLV